MHFRIRKNVVQLVRNTYDPATKKAVASVVGRMPLADPVLTDEIRARLTADEADQTEEWLASHHRVTALRSELAFLELAQTLDAAAQWLERNPDAEVVASIMPTISRSLQRFRNTARGRHLPD